MYTVFTIISLCVFAVLAGQNCTDMHLHSHKHTVQPHTLIHTHTHADAYSNNTPENTLLLSRCKRLGMACLWRKIF